MSASLPRKALIAITSYNGVFYGDGKRTGLFFTEALHPFLALTKAGFEVDLATETGTFGFDEHSLEKQFLTNEDETAYKNPAHPFMVKLKTQLKKASNVKKDEYGLFFASAGHASIYDYPHARGLQSIAEDIWNRGGIVSAVYIPRTGQINAWDNPPWVKAIEETKRKTLLIAGTLTSVCMAFPTLSALVAGYKVFCIIDASGNWSTMATDITIARIAQAGAFPIDTFAVLTELQSTWNRADAMEFAAIFADHIIPGYRALMESYDKAQSVQKFGHETKLDRLEAAQAKR